MPLTFALRASIATYALGVGIAALPPSLVMAETPPAPPALDKADVAKLRRLLAEQRQVEAPTPAEIARLRRALLTKN